MLDSMRCHPGLYARDPALGKRQSALFDSIVPRSRVRDAGSRGQAGGTHATLHPHAVAWIPPCAGMTPSKRASQPRAPVDRAPGVELGGALRSADEVRLDPARRQLIVERSRGLLSG